IPFQEGLQIKDFPTLRHVIDFVVEKLSPRNVAQAKASPATVAPLSQGEGAVEAPSLRPLPTSPRAADLPPSPPSASDAPRTEAPTGERPPTSRSPMEAMRAPVGEIPPEWIGADFEKVKNAILPMFVEKTGYPEEMLELDLDMEADLGIDTVKQAETFAEIRDHFQIPIDQSLQIKDYPTLRHVIEFVVDLLNRPQNARSSQTSSAEGAGEGETPSTPPPAAKASTAPEVRAKGEPSKMRRMIVEVVEKPLSPKKERHSLKGPILLVSDHGTPTPLDDHIVQHWPRDLSVPLVRIGHGSKSKQGRIPCDLSDFDAVARTISEIREKWGTIGGVIFLLGYGTKLNVERSQFTTWRRHLDMQVRGCFHVAKCVIPDLEETEGFFLSATNLDGFHGYGLDFIGDERKTEIENPLGAGLTGIVKTISKETHERGVRCKALDFAKMHRPLVARKIIQEILEGDSLIEVGYHARKRYGLKLTAAPLETEDPVITIDRDTTILVTGGAQGISAAICKDLAARFQPKLLLLGRTPLPEEVEHLARLDEAALQSLRMQIREELKAEGLRGTPVEVETRFTPIAKGIAIHENLEELRALGASVEYFTADAGDPQALGEVLDRIEKDHGKIDIVIHGAGVEMSKLIVDKPLEHLDQTFSGKLHGAFLLIKALRRLSTHTFVTFSSIVGRFGSYGQADYAAANEILTKLTFEAQRRLGIRGIVIDWTAWDEIGMVMRRSTRRVLLEMKVDLLSPDEGVSFLRNELLYNRDGGEVMIAGSVGPVDEDGLLDAVEVSAAVSRLEGVRKETPERFPFIDEIVACRPGRSITAKHFLDLERDRFMADHAFEGTPLLPGVMGLEAFAEAASLLTGSTLCFVGASQVAYRRPVKLLRNEGVEIFLRLRRLPPPRSATRISFHAELYSYFRNPKGEVVGGRRLNFEAVLHFASERPKNPKKRTLEIAGGIDPGIDREEIYRRFFHGPRFQVLDRVVATSEEAIVTEVRRIDPSDFFRDLPNPEFATAPMLLEALFQAAGVWEMYHHATASLPDSIWNLEIYRRIPARGKLFALARFRECEKDSRGFMRRFYDLEVIDERARAILSVQRYATISVGELPPGLRFKPVIREKVRLDDREVERLVSGHNGLDTVLSEGERRRLARFKNAERRRRWLAGQLAAKRAVQHFLSRMGGPSLSPRDIEIDQSARKSPSVTISAPGGEAVLSKGLSLSLSEETDHVVALLTPGNR
ncbi:MAG: SDR family NAD(P)-dependent oxidoreductase, partial [Deltaproteobacteria bacterium]